MILDDASANNISLIVDSFLKITIAILIFAASVVIWRVK